MVDPRQTAAEAFGIFEGGGAKGIAHLGALKAAEELNIKFVGLAGTSAGAIIAALAAVGFSSTELIDPASPVAKHALGAICNVGPLELFGTSEWRHFKRVCELAARVAAPRSTPVAAAQEQGTIFTPVLECYSACLSVLRAASKTAFWAIMAGVHGTRVTQAVRNRGWFRTDLARKYFNALLSNKINGPSPSIEACPLVLFRDLPNESPPLRIVATDLDTMSIKVFSRDGVGDYPATPDVPIADAVAASIAVPFVFAPKSLEGARYLDGGLVSNLPAWLFDEERLDRPNVPTIAFTLASDAPDIDRSVTEYLERVARSAIFGGQSIGRRAIDNLVVIAVPSSLGLLEFDASWERVTDVCIEAKTTTLDVLRSSLIDVPAQMNEVCEIIHKNLNQQLAGGRLRVNIVERISPRYLRVRFSYNMHEDADDSAFLPMERSISGEVWQKRTIVCRVGRENMKFLRTRTSEDKYREALLWRDLMSVVSVPIFPSIDDWELEPDKRPEPLGILNVDSDISLEAFMKSPEVLDFLRMASHILTNTFRERNVR